MAELEVKRVLEILATYPSREELHQEYPELEEEAIRQALEYAAANMDEQIIDLPQAV
jgi:uncharacterized protein (DUF433 family)